MMTIHIQALQFQCIIGVLDFERLKEQSVLIDLELDYEYETEYINYAELAKIIEDDMQTKQYELVETALNELFSLISSRFTQTKRIYLKITKPDIMPNCRVSVSKVKNY